MMYRVHREFFFPVGIAEILLFFGKGRWTRHGHLKVNLPLCLPHLKIKTEELAQLWISGGVVSLCTSNPLSK